MIKSHLSALISEAELSTLRLRVLEKKTYGIIKRNNKNNSIANVVKFLYREKNSCEIYSA